MSQIFPQGQEHLVGLRSCLVLHHVCMCVPTLTHTALPIETITYFVSPPFSVIYFSTFTDKWHPSLYMFKACSMMVWFTYMMTWSPQRAQQNQSCSLDTVERKERKKEGKPLFSMQWELIGFSLFTMSLCITRSVNSRHHGLHHISSVSSSFIWKFVPFGHLSPTPPRLLFYLCQYVTRKSFHP